MKKIPEGQSLLTFDGDFDISTAVMPVVEKKLMPEKKKKIVVPDSYKIMASLVTSANSLLKQAEALKTECQGNYTRKRQGVADNNLKKQDRLLSWRKIILHLISEWENETIPDIAKKIKTTKDIEFLLWNGGYPKKPDGDSADWYRKEYPAKLKKAQSLGLTSTEVYGDLVCLLGDYMTQEEESGPQKAARELREMLKKVHQANIPGFFPTPDELIDVMIDHAHIENGMSILEPEAGIASIPERLLYHNFECDITCVERQILLADVLHFKCFNVHCWDIMDWKSDKLFDRILMNPPFEKNQDIDHVMHCFNTFLKPGGKLVSIMSTGAISGTTKKHQAFRDFRELHHTYYVENGQAFKNAFNATGVSSIMLVIDKP